MDEENKYQFEAEPSRVMEDSVALELEKRENEKIRFFASCLSSIPAEKLTKLNDLTNNGIVQKEIIEYIKGNKDINYLPEEERDLILRLNMDYRKYMQEKERGSLLDQKGVFQIILNNIEKKIYSNFYNRIAFYLLEQKEIREDEERSEIIFKKLVGENNLITNE